MVDDDLVVQRIAVRPEVLRQSLIDDHDRRPALVPLRKCAAPHDGNFKGLEVACGNPRPHRGAPRSRAFGTSHNLEWSAPDWLQRHQRGSCRDLDARKRSDAANTLVNHLDHARRLFELGTRKRHAHRQDIVRIEARIDLPNRNEGSDQQPRSDQQHQGQRRLGGHQQRASLIVSQARAAAIAALFERAAQIRPRRLQSGNESKQNASQNRQGERECQNSPVEAHIGAVRPDARDIAGTEAQNGADAGVARRHTQNAAGKR